MSKKPWLIRFGVLSLLFGLAACEDSGTDGSSAPGHPSRSSSVRIYTVNYPLAWMAERIGGDAIEVVLPIPQGMDPTHWQPAPEVVLDYQSADLVLLNGVGYAGWIRFASLSEGKLVDTSRGLEDRFVEAGEITHTHGPDGEHDHGNVASHTWLDPAIATRQAEAVSKALTALGIDDEGALRARLAIVQSDLAGLDQRLAAILGPWRDKGVLYSHPVYQYLDSRYELGGRSVTWEPGQDPGEEEWQGLASRLAERPASIMLWEGDPLPSIAERLRQLGVEPVVFDLGALPPAEGDYLTIMNKNLERLADLRPPP